MNRWTTAFLTTFCAVLLAGSVASGQDAAPLPKVLLVSTPQTADMQDELFYAIRAQLSAAPLEPGRITSDASVDGEGAPQGAWQLASTTGASMLFWIDDGDICRTTYYLPDERGGRFIERQLRLKPGTPSSRDEYIAVAVATMVEKFLVTHQLRTPPPPPPAPDEPPPPPPPPKKWSKVQLVAAWDGTLFAANHFAHGFHAGVRFVPFRRVALSLSYRPHFPLVQRDDDLELSITSRVAALSLAFRMLEAPLDVQIGLAFSMDIRSFSTRGLSDAFQTRRRGTDVYSSLSPHISAVWPFSKHLGLFLCIGADIALKDTRYLFTFDEEDTLVLTPYTVKLDLCAGGIIIF